MMELVSGNKETLMIESTILPESCSSEAIEKCFLFFVESLSSAACKEFMGEHTERRDFFFLKGRRVRSEDIVSWNLNFFSELIQTFFLRPDPDGIYKIPFALFQSR